MNCGVDMSQKDPTIKLFGRKIPLPECQIPATSPDACSGLKNTEVEKSCAENCEQQGDSSDVGDGKKGSNHTELNVNPTVVEDKIDSSVTDQDKVFKKPDRILQCPRCNSLETKFCYFNNYNVNQPRHFCKNCQRYWTAGGTMRNVPVGAGRRKNKHLASQYRHVIVASEGISSTRLDNTDESGHQLVSCLESSAALRTSTDNGTALKFGPDAPLCESMESMLNLRDQKRSTDASSMNCAENGDELSLCASSVTSASTQGNESSEFMVQRERGISSNDPNTSHRLQCHPVPPWVVPLNPVWNNVASMAGAHQPPERMANPYNTDQTPMQWYPTPVVTVPGICPPSMPLQFVPAPYWGGIPVWAAGTGTLSLGSNACLSPSSSTSNSCCSGNGSPTLGKHPRDTVFTDGEKSDKCVLVPKTLRIDDPNEASRSPIWATLGIKPDKGDSKDCMNGVSQILEANPAAISRAHSFLEST
ncbi:hypothetical protein L6164_009223 [Bauhinia variegata]|uniref:Uncharacterized protein n=1 Tax=Bauhinia variegata TaxID=167791 RepID=A0ACB9PIZ4_BAUVA|nr:hypothetical protein L6164_009223 [Bauhinia variegata]